MAVLIDGMLAGRGHTDFGIVGQLHGAKPRTLRQPALGIGLKFPRDSSYQVPFVATSSLFAKQIRIAINQHTDLQRLQARDLGF